MRRSRSVLIAALLSIGAFSLVVPNTAHAAGASEGDTNAPRDFGSGYDSWGVHGGATLGQGNGLRVNVHAHGHPYGYVSFAPEAYFILGLSRDFDLGFGGSFGLIGWGARGVGLQLYPGVLLRYRIFGDGEPFQMAFEATAGPVFWVGPAVAIGIAVAPGPVFSVFVKDNMEIFFGGFLPIEVDHFPNYRFTGWWVGIDARAGFAYTLKKINLGFYAQLDFLIGGGGSRLGFTTTELFVTADGSLGLQYRF